MNEISELAKRMNSFVNNLDTHIDEAIYTVEQDLVDLNRDVLLKNTGFDNKPLINERTGSELLSAQYAKKTGKRKPDLFVNGNFQDEMRLISKAAAKTYSIFSYHNLNKYLSVQYKNAFGITKNDQPKAQEITGNAISKRLNSIVFKK